MAKQLKVILRRGIAGKREDQIKVLTGLGLKHLRQSVVLNDTPAIRGMIRKVIHLVDYEVLGPQS